MVWLPWHRVISFHLRQMQHSWNLRSRRLSTSLRFASDWARTTNGLIFDKSSSRGHVTWSAANLSLRFCINSRTVALERSLSWPNDFRTQDYWHQSIKLVIFPSFLFSTLDYLRFLSDGDRDHCHEHQLFPHIFKRLTSPNQCYSFSLGH